MSPVNGSELDASSKGKGFCLFVLIDALRPSQQLWSCRNVASILWECYPTLGCHVKNNHPSKPCLCAVFEPGCKNTPECKSAAECKFAPPCDICTAKFLVARQIKSMFNNNRAFDDTSMKFGIEAQNAQLF